MRLILPFVFTIFSFIAFSQSVLNIQCDTLNVDALDYQVELSFEGVFEEGVELDIYHYNVIEEDTVVSFSETLDFSDLDVDSFLTFSKEENSLNFSMGLFETSAFFTKIIYRKEGLEPEEFIAQ